MDVEEGDRGVVRDLEAVHGTRRRREERARAGLGSEKPHVAAEDEERVHVVVVRVRLDALEAGLEGELDRCQVGELALDRVETVAARELLSLARGETIASSGDAPPSSGGSKLSKPGAFPRM